MQDYKDFTPKAIKRALIKYATEHWSFRYSIVGIVLSLFSIAIFGFTKAIFLMIIAAFGIACLSWIYNFFIKSESFALQYLEKLQVLINEQTTVKRKQLKENLEKYGNSIGIQQIDKLQEKFDNLIDTLADKFDPGEITYKRYLGIAQNVFLSAIDNLSTVALSLKSVVDIDVKYIKKRLKKLNSENTSKEEEQTLNKRLNLYESEINKINKLLVENEKAMTQMYETTIAISDINANNKVGKINMEKSMKELEEITKRAKDYSL